MKCSRCSRELAESERYVYQGKVFCEDCLMDIGLTTKECDPWATYVDVSARRRHGIKGAEDLTDLEKRVYEFVKSKGKTTREEVMENLNLTQGELNAQLTALMHSELIKERGEAGRLYLVPIG